MKKKIAILGSTGSIGNTVLDLIDKNNFKVILLSANKNYKKLLKQAKIFNVRNLIICDQESYKKSLIYNKDKTIKIKNNFEQLNKIINKKLDYVMSSISGIDGLKPTFNIIKFTKKIAIANKESLICAWPIIKKELNKNKTDFIPVDSEHFSIWSEINNTNIKNIKKIYLTASGGPLLNYNFNKRKKIPRSLIFNHPTWKMGKKITVDSATMMNKCLEIIEAFYLFDFKPEDIGVLIHPESIIHSIVNFLDGSSLCQFSEPNMQVPISYALSYPQRIYSGRPSYDLAAKNLTFQKPDLKKFPSISFAYNALKASSNHCLVMNAANEIAVENFLKQKISFNNIFNIISDSFDIPNNEVIDNIDEILYTDEIYRSKINKTINKYTF